jgi:hypothetical protein
VNAKRRFPDGDQEGPFMIAKHRLIGLALVALATSSCWPFGFRPVSPDPRLVVDREQHDFGSIPPTETVEAVFTVSNTGGKTLEITKIQTSCGCTAGMMDSQSILSGKSSRLRVTYDPRGKNGPQHRVLTLSTNDPLNPQKQLGIHANVAAVAPPQPAATPPAPNAVPASGPEKR